MSESTFIEAPLIERRMAGLACARWVGRTYNADARCALATSDDARSRRVYTSTNYVLSTRQCWDCETVKPLDDFYRNKNKPFGREYRCKACTLAARRAKVAA